MLTLKSLNMSGVIFPIIITSFNDVVIFIMKKAILVGAAGVHGIKQFIHNIKTDQLMY